MLKPIFSVCGRLRWQHPDLKKASYLESLLDELKSIDGVEKIESNAVTGSLLILYRNERDTLAMERLTRKILEKYLPKVSYLPQKKQINTFAKIGAAISLGSCVVSLGFKAYKVHAIAGVIGLSLIAYHTYYYKKSLFR